MLSRRAFVAGAAAGMVAGPGAWAQQATSTRKIALIDVGRPTTVKVEGSTATWSAFLIELRRLGHVEGRNIVVERYSGQSRTDPYASLAREVADSRPDVIVANSTLLIIAINALTTSIPIVAIISDPVASGLVASLAHPGGNITAFTTDAGPEINGKVLQLLKESVPVATRMAYLELREYWDLPRAVVVRASADRLGLTLFPVLLDHPILEISYRDAFATIVRERVDAIFVGGATENYSNLVLIAELALSARLPAAFLDPRFPRAGGLLSYGPDLNVNMRGMAGYVDRILKGAKPADLPVQLPKEFEFIINLKTAKAIGIEIPYQVLAVATEVIE